MKRSESVLSEDDSGCYGLYKLVRNPRHHEKFEDSENDAIKIILFIDYIIEILEKSKSQFDIDDIRELIFDEEFVNDDEYVKLIMDKIPKRKIYEVLITIYRKKEEGSINNIKIFFHVLFSRLS